MPNATSAHQLPTLGQCDERYMRVVNAGAYASLQAAIDANPGKAIFAPEGTYAPFVVEDDNTKVYGAGPGNTFVITTSLTGHAAKFYPNDTTATSVFLNNCGIADLTIYSSADKTAGAGVYALQCNGFRCSNVQIQNHPEGMVISGGQLNLTDRLTVFATSSVLTGAPVSNSQAIRLCEAPIDGGLYQECLTCQFTNTIVGTNRCLDKGIRIESADGASFIGGYISGAYSDEIYIKCATAGRYISSVDFSGGFYLDGVSMTTAPTNRNGINIPASAVGTVYQVTYNGGTIGNYTGKGCVVGEDMQQLAIVGGTKFVNIDNWAIDFVGSNTFSEVIVNACQFGNVGEVTTNTGGVRVSTVANVVLTGNTFSGIGNTGASAITTTGTNGNGVVDNNVYYGCTTNVTDSATWTKIVGLPQAWTPSVTFATPGNLSLGAYTTRIGRSMLKGNICTADFTIQVVPTHTTASGDLQITGMPVQSTSVTMVMQGALYFSGITKAGYTNFVIRKDSNNGQCTFMASGSGVANGKVTAADVPSGGTLILAGTITYECLP